MNWRGRVRIYRSFTIGPSWSIDAGSAETRHYVHEIYSSGIPLITRIQIDAPEGEPRQWMQGFGKVTIESGRAIVESILER